MPTLRINVKKVRVSRREIANRNGFQSCRDVTHRALLSVSFEMNTTWWTLRSVAHIDKKIMVNKAKITYRFTFVKI